MIISVVEIDMPRGMERAKVDAAIQQTAPRYRNVDGLLYKYYTAKEPDITGGVFIWKTRQQAEAAYSDPEWLKIIQTCYGTEPRITYYEVKLIVDNVLEKIYTDTEAQNF
jgi:hypothetical protein|tara:strand:+ start:2216 stop:2545 length:330 start_codon:yes stop_codon:yes gene_type:complete